MKMSLKFKLIAMFFIFISVPMVGLGVVSSTMASNSLQALTEEELREYAENANELIEQSLDSVSMYVQVLSSNDSFAKLANGDESARREVHQTLKNLQSENDDMVEMLILTDQNANGIISNSEMHLNLDLTSREYVKQALSGIGSQSPVILSKASGEAVIALAYPLEVENQIVGTLIGTIRFDSISEHVAKLKVGENGYGYMIDRDGLILYHPVEDKILNENLGDFNIPGFEGLLGQMKAGKEGEGYYTYQGIKKFVRFIPVSEWTIAITANYDEYMAAAINIKKITLLITVISLVVSILSASILASRNIIGPIKTLENLMTQAGEGDLRVQSDIHTKDEIESLGNNFNKMIKSQSSIIGSVRQGAIELASASDEISASSEEISVSTEEIASNIGEVAKNASEQNQSIIETSEVLVQLSSLIQIAQKRAVNTQTNSNKTIEVAQEGRNNVERTMNAIERIDDAAVMTTDTLQLLDDLSKKVSGIVTTINNISEQTNLLALNATIEAARAGEHGKGFSVVADEVRKLSEQTSEESNGISEVVNEMVKHIEKAVSSMKQGKDAVDNGLYIVKETDQSFISIMNAVEQIVKDVAQIVDVTQEEVASSDQILKLIDSVALITEMTAANSQEVAAAAEEQTSISQNMAASSEETTAMASTLSGLVEEFKI